MGWKRRRTAKKPGTSDATITKQDDRVPYQQIVQSNDLFLAYYRQSGVCHDEADFEAFVGALRRPLPSSFRVSRMHLMRDQIDAKLHAFASSINALLSTFATDQSSEDNCLGLRPLKWHPSAWQLTSSRSVLKRDTAYTDFHAWLVNCTEAGEITRQEVVSMIPPMLLDVKRGMRVVDLCAAPGSKTSQLIEYLHQSEGEVLTELGFVLANEIERDRAYMLVHHVKRLQSPCLVVCSHDATLLPNIPDATSYDGRLHFDRVLADVPCSGDGTLRKNPAIWRSWTPAQGIGLHPLQVRILERAIKLVDPVKGGRVVYSTCSLNPVENEAVVLAVLQGRSNAKLVDAKIDGFRTRPGMRTWQVMLKGGSSVNSIDDLPEDIRPKFPSTIFPDPSTDVPLERCLRVMPQDQDTGAFFVAVIDVLPNYALAASLANHPTASTSMSSIKNTPFGEEEPFRLLGDDFLQPIFAFYGISASNNSLSFLTRSSAGQPPKCIHCVPLSFGCFYTTSSAESSSNNNDGSADGTTPPAAAALRIVTAGARCFDLFDNTRHGSLPCPYRVNMEGIPIIMRIATKRVYTAIPSDIQKLLAGSNASDGEESVRKCDLSPVLQAQIGSVLVGGAIFITFPSSAPNLSSECNAGNGAMLAVPVWIGDRNVKCFVAKIERPALLAHLSFTRSTF